MEAQSKAENLWISVKKALKTRLPEKVYGMWFVPIRPVEVKNEKLLLEVRDVFCECRIRDNYSKLLLDIISECAKRPFGFEFVVRQGSGAEWTEKAKAGQVGQKNGAGGHSPKLAGRIPAIFNPNYTFETLVVSENNRMAHGAAIAAAQAPGKAYNPVFIYGEVGLGKTHLLHAIGHHVSESRRPIRVVYLSCERFTNEFIDSLQNNRLTHFRRKYRQTDILLLDDVQFLSGKERTQEEFFHTFNALHESRKQIVVTCDSPAGEISGLEQRLSSRFEWGMSADLQPPDTETRLAILRKKAKSMGADLSHEILELLADRIRANIRRLEGALIRVASYTQISLRNISVEVVENLLRDVFQTEEKSAITIEQIQRQVASHYDIRLADMSSRRRPENIVFPRQVAMFLCRQLTDKSLGVIGEAFGRRHGTVLHACRLVKDRMDTDASIREVVFYLEKHLQR